MSSSGAATVSGENVESEIYIRPDGKKVRRTKRVVRKSGDAASVVSTTNSTTSNSSAGATAGGLGGFLGTSGVKKASSATVSGDFPARTGAATISPAAPAEQQEGEIYIRADGKKVRRVKKVVSGASSVVSSPPPAAAPDLAPAPATEPKKSLTSFLDFSGRAKKSGSATVGGDRPTAATVATAPQMETETEIYIRPDGKKVRRIKKVVHKQTQSGNDLSNMIDSNYNTSTGAATVSGNANVATESEIYINSEGKKVRRIRKVAPSASSDGNTSNGASSLNLLNDSKESAAGSAGAMTVAGDRPTQSSGEGEIYIRADGKKVRRIKKPKADADATADAAAIEEKKTLGGFLGVGTGAKKTGSATVAGDQLVKKEETEIYIRPDGKKVRRIKKTVVRKTDDDLTAPPVSSTTPAAAAPAPVTPSSTSPAPGAEPAAEEKKTLGSFLDLSPRSRKSGSATVTGIPMSQKAATVAAAPVESEIYINAQGKKVRRIKKQTSVAASVGGEAAAGGTPPITQRAPSPNLAARAVSPATTTTPLRAASPGQTQQNLSNLLGSSSSHAALSQRTGMGAATVGGEKHVEGEIYIRADGKKVRRVKKADVSASTNNIGNLLNKDAAAGNKLTGSATVAGDQVVVATTDEGEIIIRADGKKVLRRRKPQPAGAQEEEGEVYRRADGKLVRRVKRNQSNAAGDLAGLLENKDEATQKQPGAAATVAPSSSGGGDKKGVGSSLTDLFKRKPSDADKNRPTTPQTAPMSEDSTLKDEAAESAAPAPNNVAPSPKSPKSPKPGLAAGIRSWLSPTKREKPESDQTQSLAMSGIAAPPLEQPTAAELPKPPLSPVPPPKAPTPTPPTPEPPKAPTPPPVPAPPKAPTPPPAPQLSEPVLLTADEEAIASQYRKMAKMGLPPEALRHKMLQDDVPDRIVTGVLQGDSSMAPMPEQPKVVPEPAPVPAPAPAPVPPPVAAPAPAPASSSQLSEEDEMLAVRFRKMVKMGMPEDAVRHKMSSEDVPAYIQDAVFSASAAPAPAPISSPAPTSSSSSRELTQEDEAVASRFRKMVKMGMPEDAIRFKMDQEGVEAHIQNAVFLAPPEVTTAPAPAPAVAPVTRGSSSGALSEEDEAIASRFRKMVKMGMPEDAIRFKMDQEGVEAHIQDAIFASPAAPTASPESSLPSAPAPAAATSSQQLSDEDEATASRFRKMVKMGMPEDAIRFKMDQEGVERHIQDAVFSAAAPPTTLAAPPPAPTPAAASSVQLSADEEEIASRFRKMAKMGLPEDAVRHKMLAEGVDDKIISAVFAPVDSAPAPVAAPAPTVQLSAEEEAIAARFRKMAKMGLPEDAVRHKMLAEGVDEKVISAVFAPADTGAAAAPPPPPPTTSPPAVQLSADEEAIASRFRKMAKMGLPEDAVRHKMLAEGVDEKVISAVFAPADTGAAAAPPPPPPTTSPPAVQLSADEEAIASRFRKMAKMGLPEDAVRHKMLAEGVDDKIISAVFAPAAAPAPVPATAPAPSVHFSADEEAIASRFRKMAKMGLPEDAVRHKMLAEGVDDKIISAVFAPESAAAPAPAYPVAPAPMTCFPALSEDEQTVVASYKKMLKMGMPQPAVEHKMSLDGVDPKLVPYVMSDDRIPAAAPQATRAPQTQVGDSAVAYIVVVPDEPKPGVGGFGVPISQAPPDAIVKDPSSIKLHPDEKFAVKVDEDPNKKSSEQGETKYMTLEQIAELSGQSVDQLQHMVKDKRSKDESIPRFVLQPLEERPTGPLFEVEVPKGGGAPPAPGGTTVPAGVVVPKMNAGEHLASVKEGEEVVDTKLANAVRAVSALGDGDMGDLLEKLKAGEMGELIEKLREAEKRQKKLEKQLAQAGVKIAEDIDYGEAKVKVSEIAKRMNEIGGSDVTVEDKELQNKLREEYFKLEQEMERYNNALMLTEEYQQEQDAAERRWEEENIQDNLAALRSVRRHMPVMIRHMSEADLCNNPSPNGKFLPKATAKKFKRTNVLQLLRLNPDDIERMHPASLEGMRVTGLTLTERRALYAHLKPVAPKWEKNKSEKMTERKWTWYQMMKNNFKENLAPWKRHVDQYGPPGNHPSATRDNPNAGCPLIGKQCPIKADLVIDYTGDYGYTEADEYEVSDVKKSDCDDPGAKAMAEALELAKEKKANERADLLKKHYKGKLLQVSKANGSCETMDEAMDKMEFYTSKWIEFVIDKGGPGETEDDKKKEITNFNEALTEFKLIILDFAQRSGMQMSGKRKAGGDTADPRSSVECSLSEEVYECWGEFSTWIKDRMKKIEISDTKVEKTIELLQGMLGELHGRNLATLEKLGIKRAVRSRKWKKNVDLQKEVEDRQKPKEEEAPAAEEAAPTGRPAGLPPGAGGRGGLMDAIAGRGRGPPGGGRGGLLDAIAGRGKKPAGGGGRGGLLDAIAGRGKKPAGGGGRGGLLDAIAGRGKKPAGGGDDGGGRGGLMAAIAARGKGGGGGRGGGDAGGRGGLLAAIAARGGGG